MMTPEEIKEATSMLKWHTPTVSHKTMAKALSSLTEAYAEIERLQKIVDWGDGGNSRALPSLAARAMERAAKKRTT